MIRIIYEWRVESSNLDRFQETWRQTTTGIHETVPGARGSFLLLDDSDASRILTIARWDSVEDWKAFWGSSDPNQMQPMRELGERISVKVYNEAGDFTV